MDSHSTMVSDPMVLSASWLSIDEARSQVPMYVPSVVEVDDSQRHLPSPVERLSSAERKLYANFRLDRSSDQDYAPPAGSIDSEDRITQVPSPPPFVPPFLRPGAGFGFAPDSSIPSGCCAFIPAFPPAAVPLFRCPRGTMSLLLIPRNEGATPPPRRIALPPFVDH